MVLTEIEGVLNCRQLTPLSANFDNFEMVTSELFFYLGDPSLLSQNRNMHIVLTMGYVQ